MGGHEERGGWGQGEVVVDRVRATPGGLESLDAAGGRGFDRLRRLAVSMLDATSAAVSVQDTDRQIFVSRAGAPLTIEDTRREAAPPGSSSIAAGTRSYMGVPLISAAGEILGAIWIMDEIPRRWSVCELDVLSALVAATTSEARALCDSADRFLAVAREQLVRSREETIWRLAGAIAGRGGQLDEGSDAMGRTCALLARRMGIDEGRVELIQIAGPLRDVGRIAIPGAILGKPGPLDAAEREVVQTHAGIGHRMLTGSGEPLLELAALIALTHHERMDGRGYPAGLSGDGIPIEGRIATVADAFHALTTDRADRPALSHTGAIEMMEAGRGTHFDPPLLDSLRDELASGTPTTRPPLRPGAEP